MARKKAVVKKSKKGWNILKVFELLVFVGSVAAVIVKMLQGKKK